MPNKPRIAVIGAGLAGLTAAWRLRQAGLAPTVFEAQRQPGGRMRSTVAGGMIHDLGAWTYTAGGKVDRLAQALGLTNAQVALPPTLGRPVAGRLRIGNLRRPISLVGTVFNSSETFQALRAFHLARTLPGKSADDNAATWAARRFPPGFIQAALVPLAGLFFLQCLEDLSRDALLGTLRYLAHIRLKSFQKGMGYLTSHMASDLDLRYGLTVGALQLEGARVRVRGNGYSQLYDGLLVATPLPEVLKLMHSWWDPATRNLVSNWPHAAALAVRILLKTRFARPVLQVLPPRGLGGLACGLTMERAKHVFRVPAGQEAVVMYARPEKVSTLETTGDQDVAEVMARELTTWLGVPRQQMVEFWVQRWPCAVACCDPQAHQRATALEVQFCALADRIPVWFAGDYLGSSSLEGAVASAEKAARACRIHFQSKAA